LAARLRAAVECGRDGGLLWPGAPSRGELGWAWLGGASKVGAKALAKGIGRDGANVSGPDGAGSVGGEGANKAPTMSDSTPGAAAVSDETPTAFVQTKTPTPSDNATASAGNSRDD
jgi:hypothetical protein